MVAEVFIFRICSRPPGVARPCAYNSLQKPEPGVRSPESAEAKGRRLQVRRNLQVQGRFFSGPDFPGEKEYNRQKQCSEQSHFLRLPEQILSVILHHRRLFFLKISAVPPALNLWYKWKYKFTKKKGAAIMKMRKLKLFMEKPVSSSC